MTSSRLALVVGTGRKMWDEFYRSPWAATVFAVNHAALFLPRVEHAVSVHGGLIGGFALSRLSRHPNDALAVHAPQAAPGVTMVWDERVFPFAGHGGTSSLFAVRIAIRLGFKRIILAGVPLDTGGHFYDPEDYAFPTNFSGDLAEWAKLRIEHTDIEIRSHSGNTRTLFGAYYKEVWG